MAKLVVKIKGQSEEFGLTDDARDIGGNDYLTISNGNKKQYARLGNNVTKLIVRKNNQKFYVQKDPVYFSEKIFPYQEYVQRSFDVYFPVGNYHISLFEKKISISTAGLYKVTIILSGNYARNQMNMIITNGSGVISNYKTYDTGGTVSITKI